MRVIVMRSNVRRLVMDQVTKVRRQLKREEWKSIISECRASAYLTYTFPHLRTVLRRQMNKPRQYVQNGTEKGSLLIKIAT